MTKEKTTTASSALERYQINPQTVQSITASIEAGRSAIVAAGAGDFGACMAMGAAVVDLQGLISNDQHIAGMLMSLQGKSLGFRTDMDQKGGYPVQTVIGCAVEAYLKGLPPVGNCWNIIAGRTYVTKEGFEFLLRKAGAVYTIVPGMPENEKIEPSPIPGKPGARTVELPVTVFLGENKKGHSLRFVIRQNAGMTADAVIGKAKARALKWIYEQIQTNPLLSVEAAPEMEPPVTMNSIAATAKAATALPSANAASNAAPPKRGNRAFVEAWLTAELERNHLQGSAKEILDYAVAHGYDITATEWLADAMPRILREMAEPPKGTVPGPDEVAPEDLPEEIPA